MGLGIFSRNNPKQKPLRCDFADPKTQHRLNVPGKELLLRAIGLNKYPNATILDTTAGLGKDAFLIAAHGAEVILCEQHEMIAAILEDGLQRGEHSAQKDIIKCMQLIKQDALAYLTQLKSKPDIIYLDPMFPERQSFHVVHRV